MLVITRREGEEVVVGDPRNPLGIVRIASIKGDRIRLAFDFPRSIDVHRREVAEQIAAEEVPEGGEGQDPKLLPEIEVRVKDAAAPA
ncbi:MAG: carbon storage regulator [Phycisphaerales bacterium JB060]